MKANLIAIVYLVSLLCFFAAIGFGGLMMLDTLTTTPIERILHYQERVQNNIAVFKPESSSKQDGKQKRQ